jgi:hypothetical protein
VLPPIKRYLRVGRSFCKTFLNSLLVDIKVSSYALKIALVLRLSPSASGFRVRRKDGFIAGRFDSFLQTKRYWGPDTNQLKEITLQLKLP